MKVKVNIQKAEQQLGHGLPKAEPICSASFGNRLAQAVSRRAGREVPKDDEQP